MTHTLPRNRRGALTEPAVTGTADAVRGPTHQAFLVLRTGFTVAPIIFGLDKFPNLLVE